MKIQIWHAAWRILSKHLRSMVHIGLAGNSACGFFLHVAERLSAVNHEERS